MQFDLWKYPTDGRAEDNVRRATAHHTSDRRRCRHRRSAPAIGEIAFLSDSGGHANIWVTNPDTGELRQITYERDPGVALGVPIWSPDGKWIAFVSSRGNTGLGVWRLARGSRRRQPAQSRRPRTRRRVVSRCPMGLLRRRRRCSTRSRLTGGSPVRCQTGPARNVVGFDGKTLYFMVDRTLTDGQPGVRDSRRDAGRCAVARARADSREPRAAVADHQPSRCRPTDSRSRCRSRTASRPTSGRLSTSTGEWRQVTDFGDRPTFIARRVSWSAGRSIDPRRGRRRRRGHRRLRDTARRRDERARAPSIAKISTRRVTTTTHEKRRIWRGPAV